MNGLPRQSNQNRMIPYPLSPKLLEVKYAAYCTTVSPIPSKGSRHTIFAPTPIGTPVHTSHSPERLQDDFLGPEFSDAECRRESRQALTGSTAIEGMML